jgi:hypothetical protein
MIELIEKKKPYSDSELILEFKKHNDLSAFEMLFDRYSPLVFVFCQNYLNNIEDSQIAVTEIFSQLFEDLIKEEISNIRFFLYIKTKKYCRDKTRHSSIKHA